MKFRIVSEEECFPAENVQPSRVIRKGIPITKKQLIARKRRKAQPTPYDQLCLDNEQDQDYIELFMKWNNSN